jgi:hypothetical protein
MQITLQSIVMEAIMYKLTGDQGLGEKWMNVVSQRDFVIEGDTQTYRYAQGQPVGGKLS